MEDHNIYQEPTNPFSVKFELRRRDFFKLLGAGLYIYFQLGDSLETLAADTQQRRTLPTDYNAFLHISENGNVSGFSGKIEMGQGIITSLAQMLADELDVPFEKVKMVLGDTQLCPWDAGTWGSLTTRQFGPFFVAAAAEARAVFLSMGAEALQTTVDNVYTEDGAVLVKGNPSKKITYADLTKGKRIERFMTEKPKVKDYSEYKIRGKSFNRVDSELKVTGKAQYAGDFRMPGMLYAKILRPPSHGATLVSADTSTAEKMEGVTIIKEKEMVAVLHADPEKAEKALATVKAEYSFDEKKVDDKTVFQYMLQSNPNARETNKKGELALGKEQSAHIFESEFYNSYVAHAPIEPHTALAWTEGEKVIIRASTQTPFPIQDSVARDLGLTIENVRVITPFVGGAFGGKGAFRQANEAAKLAKLSGKPVMVQWTRQEEFFYDTFRPAAVVKVTSGIDKEGKITLWDYNEYYAGSRGSDTIYDVPHQRTTSYSANNVHPFGTGAWRAPANNTNTYSRESQIDMMAEKAGIDPIEFRLKNLKDERMIGVLKALKELVNWKPAVSPSGRGIGVACGFDAGGYVASMAEVKVDKKTGHVEVVRVATAQEIGYCINPLGATMQMESCITMGLGYALTEEVEFTGGDVKTKNFGTYDIPKFSWLPKIETKIMDMKTPPQGGGEPAIIVMGGVIANAIYDAIGVRMYQLPMTPERILAALSKK